jgi:uncharacterized protein YlxP (DUF503 family)
LTIGFCRLELYLPAAASLKDRRQVARSMTARIRNKFNVAVSELGDDRQWRYLTIGVCSLSNDSSHANQILSRVVSYVEHSRDDFELLDYSTEMIPGM